MKILRLLGGAYWVLASAFACSGPEDSGTPSAANTSAASVGVCLSPGATIAANAANNYAFHSALSFDVSTVKSGTDLTFDWTGLTTDFLTQPVNALTDIDLVLVVLWQLSPEELAERMNADSLTQSDAKVYANFYPDDLFTSAQLFSAQVSRGTPVTQEQILKVFDPATYDPSMYTYTLMARTGESVVGVGTRMIKVFKIDPAASDTTVALSNTSTQLEWHADLSTAAPTLIPAGTNNISIDWGAMTTTGMGTPFKPTRINEVLVAHYPQTPEQLAADFLNLEHLASEEYRGPVTAGTSVSFSQLTNETGQPFPGIDNTGTWLVALKCGTCANPAPWYLSRLTTCP